MPAGPNGKLYGAVTTQTIADELAKHGYQIERKKIELPGTSIKNVGKYKALVKLYESASAEITITVVGQEIKTETRKAPPAKPFKKRRDGHPRDASAQEGAPGEAPQKDAPSADTPKPENVSTENITPDAVPAESASQE
jgi:large subunit ribosomal protein L9